MKLLHIIVFISTFQVIHSTKRSLVELKNNGYEGIIIAISPNIPEDHQIIDNIKTMMMDASTYMLKATKNRTYIRSVTILIPQTWKSNSTYGRPRRESYDTADVIIADPSLLQDEPYTLQYGGCGQPGKYIHLTPNFILNEKMIPIYGPRGKLFIHEWAHLRWGVFDEYDYNRPYYLSGQRNIEATRCPMNLKGENKIFVYAGSVQTVEDCLLDEKTGIYEEGCMFLPDADQTVKQSIMYGQALDSVHEFCDQSSHNPEAPNQQNRLCNYMSTWDVIMRSELEAVNPLADTNVPKTTFKLLQYKERVITLVLDISGSMQGHQRIQRMYQAAEVFIMQIVESGSYVGIVIFSSGATITSNLVKITDTLQRQKLKELLPQNANGGTNICSGVQKGFEVNGGFDGNTFGTEIVLLTDGEDGGISSCFNQVTASGAIIHTVALGPSADKALEQLADMTGGLKLYASDNVDANGLIDSFSGIKANTGNVTQQSIQIESTTTSIASQACLNGTVTIDNTVGNNTFFLVTWQVTIPKIILEDPTGKAYRSDNFVSDAVSKSARLAIPGTAERGPWKYSLCNNDVQVQVLGLTVNSQAVNPNVPPIVVETHMNADTNAYPNPMIVYAIVTQGLAPVVGAKVIATIEPQSGKVQTLELLDNGAGADIFKNDGIYSKYFLALSGNGRYSLKVRVYNDKGDSKIGEPKNRALYIPGYVKNGTIISNPPRPNVTTNEPNLENFSRTASGGAFTVSEVPTGPIPDIFKPETINDLHAEIVEKHVILTWTATGDDLDRGNASMYDLRMSLDYKDLIKNFENTTAVNISGLTPKPAGSSETFAFQPETIDIKNGTIIYFALIAIDKVSLKSDISNLARATLFLPPPPPPPPPPPKTTPGSGSDCSRKLNTMILVLMTMSALLMTSLVL
ncbi:calcium-activated chloride channel regulator 1-like [Discoglossus pictus]